MTDGHQFYAYHQLGIKTYGSRIACIIVSQLAI